MTVSFHLSRLKLCASRMAHMHQALSPEARRMTISAAVHNLEGKTMGRIIRKTGIGEFFSMMGSAIDVAAALETGRRPHARDLRLLGIDPLRFNRIKSF